MKIKSLLLIAVILLVGSTGVVLAERTAVITPGIQQLTVVGACFDNNNGVATTSLFAVNPFFGVGTSTVIYGNIYGTNDATTTDIAVGTSTTPALPFNSSSATLKENYMFLSGVSTTSQFFLSAGLTKNISITSGVNAAGVVVGPTEYLLGYSTSTTAGKGNGGLTAGTVPAPASCTYKFIFSR